MQGTLAEVRSIGDIRSFHAIPAVVGCFQMRRVAALRSRVNVMICTGRLSELPQILEFVEINHGLGIPLLGFLSWNFGGAHVDGNFAGQPEICVAGNVDCANREVRVRRRKSAIAGLKRCDSAKLAKIGLRCVENVLETPAGFVLLVLALRECGNSEETRKEKREKIKQFSVHDVLAPDIRHACALSEDRAGGAPAAASAYLTDSSYVRTILQLVKKEMV